jgi:ribosomal protein S8
MNLLITENQYKVILLESNYSSITKNIKELKEFGNKVLNLAYKKFGLNLKLLTTWGASVGGLVLPLDNFIRSGEFNLTEDQSYLILVGVTSFLFFESKGVISNIFRKVKKEGIEDEFKKVLKVGIELKNAFIGFLNSLNITVFNVMELAAYSFLIPIITDILDLSDPSSDIIETSKLITKRIASAGILIVSSEALFRAIQKILKRFN